MFFEVFQARVDYLLHAEHLRPEQVSDIVNVPVCICKTSVNLRETNIDSPGKIVQALIVDQNAHQHGNRGEGSCGKRRHQLIGNYHLSTILPDGGPKALYADAALRARRTAIRAAMPATAKRKDDGSGTAANPCTSMI
jgi:hypothetical protein